MDEQDEHDEDKAKSQKTERRIPYRESSLHINYLYQLATCTLSQNPENTQLVRFYMQTMQSIAKKLVLRIDPSIKRTLCKKCYMLLVPGVSATVRIRSSRRKNKHTVVQCLECNALKRFTSNADYKLWTEQTEAWVKRKETGDGGTQPTSSKGGCAEKDTCNPAAAAAESLVSGEQAEGRTSVADDKVESDSKTIPVPCPHVSEDLPSTDAREKDRTLTPEDDNDKQSSLPMDTG